MSAAIRAGRAFVELFLKDAQLTAGLNAAKLKLQSFAAAATQIGSSMAFTGAAMLGPLSLATKAAGDLQGAMSKLRAVFGDQADGTIEWMESFTASVGRGKKETADSLSAFQAFFVGMNIGKDEAAALSKEMTALAVDFGSFHNISDPEAAQRMISAFSGSSEVLDMFGINIKQTALDMKLLEMGFPEIAKGATELQKVLARQSIIKESMGKQGAIGDAIRTAHEYSNVTKSMTAVLMEMVAKIGTAAMPIFTQWMQSISNGAAWLSKFVAENSGLIQIIAQVAGSLTVLGGGILIIGKVVGGAVGAFTLLHKAISSLGALAGITNPLVATLTAVGVVLGTVGYALGVFDTGVREVSHAMREQAEANKKARSDAEVQMARLQQLAEKQSLSNDETKEASALIDALQGKYGNLGLSIDSVTGKISGMTEAQKALSAAMKAGEIADTKKALHETEQHVAELSKGWGQLTAAEIIAQDAWGSTAGQDRLRNLEKERDIEFERIKAMKARLAALGGEPDVSAVESEKKRVADEQKKKTDAERRKALVDKGDEAAGDLEKFDDERRREAMTDTERQIDDVKIKARERQKLLRTTMAGEHARQGGARPEMLEFGKRLEDQYTKDEENDIAAIQKKAADEEAKKIADATRAQTDQIAMKELELKFAAKAGETEAQAAAREHAKRLAVIELEREQALGGLADGADAGLLNRSADLDKALEEAAFSAQNLDKTEKQINAAGTFNASVIGRIGQDSIDKQQFTELVKQTKLLQKIEQKEGGIEFGNNM